MLKKVIYIVLSLFLGVLILINVYYRAFYTQFQKATADAVKKEEYGKVLQFYSFATDANYLYNETLENGMHIVIASSISDKINKDKNKDNKEYSYYSYEQSIVVGLFNLPSDFKTADTKDGDNTLEGGVSLNFASGESLFYRFGEEIVNGNSYYNYIQYYSFLPINIYRTDFEADLLEHNISTTDKVTSVSIYDGAHTEIAKMEFSTDTFNFDKAFYSNYGELLTNYNEYQKLLADEKANDKETQNKASELLTEINKITTDNNYLKQHSVTIVTKSSGFITTLVIAAVIFLIVDGVVGFFIFRKKKAPVRVMPQKKAQAVKANSAPETFTRNDIIDVDATEKEAPADDAAKDVTNNDENK